MTLADNVWANEIKNLGGDDCPVLFPLGMPIIVTITKRDIIVRRYNCAFPFSSFSRLISTYVGNTTVERLVTEFPVVSYHRVCR